jgi:hypothetical protein
MKKTVYLIVGSVIVVGAIIFLRKKKVADNKVKAEETAKAEAILKSDFDIAVHNAGVVQAEAMNIDLINEKKAKSLMPTYDSVWKQIFALGTVTNSNIKAKNLRAQLKDIEKQVKDLGYTIHSSPRSSSGSFVTKKII